MECKTDLLNDEELYGWPCHTTLTNLTIENEFYIKCKDKPWWENCSDEDKEKYEPRNINAEDFVYALYVSENELKIDSILPQGKIEAGFEPISMDLEVETSGGVDNGICTCYYEWAGNWIQFLDTFSDYHKQKGLDLMGGDFNISIKCEDDAENIAYGNADFSLNVDSSAPIVVRAYKSGNNLKLITNEKARCYYDFNGCDFALVNGSSMSYSLSTEHTSEWIIGQTYYIKCKDIWENENPTCAIIVEPSNLN